MRGLIADGPVRLVTEELARLDHEAERAERAAERWEQIAAHLDAQRAAHRAEDDGAAYLAAVESEAAASARLSTAGRFGRRKVRAEHRTATERTQTVRGQVSSDWGTIPTSTDRLPEWAGRVAARRAEGDPRVTEAVQTVEALAADREALWERHEQERLALLVREYGQERVRRDQLGMRTTYPHRAARDARNHAALTRAEADELRRLPITEAAQCIEAKRAEQEHLRQRAAERAQRLPEPFAHDPHRSGPRRERPTQGL